MIRPLLAPTLMAGGAVLALIAAAGPIADSPSLQAWFGVSLLTLVAGAVLRRVSARQQAVSAEAGGHVGRALNALESLSDALEQTRSRCGSIDETPRFTRLVAEETQPPIREFLDHRQALLDAFGLGPFAELMTRFAVVERQVNRCLSASADGARDEALRCLDRAREEMAACLAARPDMKRHTV